jgi:hypothetical protein
LAGHINERMCFFCPPIFIFLAGHFIDRICVSLERLQKHRNCVFYIKSGWRQEEDSLARAATTQVVDLSSE